MNINIHKNSDKKQACLNFGLVGNLVFAALWLLGIYFTADQGDGLERVAAGLKFTLFYALAAGGGGLAGNLLRLYTRPASFIGSGSMYQTFKKKFFWDYGPQIIGIGIGSLIAVFIV